MTPSIRGLARARYHGEKSWKSRDLDLRKVHVEVLKR